MPLVRRRAGYWSPVDGVHTRLPHSFKKKTSAGQREETRGRSRSCGSFLPDHRQNKQLAIFAMHLLLSHPLSPSLFQSRTRTRIPSSRTRLPAICLLCRLYLTATEIQSRQCPGRTIRPHVYSSRSIRYLSVQSIPKPSSVNSTKFFSDCSLMKEVLMKKKFYRTQVFFYFLERGTSVAACHKLGQYSINVPLEIK